ncbi:MAG: AAA family ATPase [Acidimicrobiales bacterium]
MLVAFSLLGALRVESGGSRLSDSGFPSRKAKQACELLAVAGGRPVSKERLIELLWGDRLPKDPTGAVDHTMSLLRRSLETAAGTQPIVTERGHYRLDLSVSQIDTVQFDALVDVRGLDAEAALDSLLAALDLVRGTVLEDEPYQPWAEAVRERYRQKIERARLDAASLALSLHRPQLALDLADRARQDSPTVHEEASTLGVSALQQLGRRHEAMVRMAELERRMSDEFGAALSPRAVLVGSLLRQGGEGRRVVGRVPVLTRTTDRAPSELPFLGRDRELAAIGRAADRLRAGLGGLVTIDGAAGLGRSRLLAEGGSLLDDGLGPDHVVRFACLPSDPGLPLFVASRLARLLTWPERRPAIGSEPSAPGLYDVLVDALDRREAPTALLIDDLQWADQASLAVLSSLLQPGALAHPLLMVATRRLRAGAADPEPRAGAVHHPAPVALVLAPLPPPVLAALPVEHAWDETGGHPGLLAACMISEQGDGSLGDDGLDLLSRWVDDLGPGGRTLLQAAAELERSFTVDDVARRLGLAPAAAGQLLEGPELLHLARRLDEGGRTFELAGDLLRRWLAACA